MYIPSHRWQTWDFLHEKKLYNDTLYIYVIVIFRLVHFMNTCNNYIDANANATVVVKMATMK